ncbi:divalent cation tolerance protein CutA [Streptomyces sp. NPDC060064]|uniref:divalent cation tolerance protein CutA n=1 Tax=Streptomyces sp. NPDC060064 TaxID=3347049 RepID=UPI0036A124FB
MDTRPRAWTCEAHRQTTAARYPELEAHLLEHHPWKNLEINAVPIVAGSAAGLDWIARSAAE